MPLLTLPLVRPLASCGDGYHLSDMVEFFAFDQTLELTTNGRDIGSCGEVFAMRVLRRLLSKLSFYILSEVADQLCYIEIASHTVGSNVRKLPRFKSVWPDRPAPLRGRNGPPTPVFQGGNDGPNGPSDPSPTKPRVVPETRGHQWPSFHDSEVERGALVPEVEPGSDQLGP